MKTIGYAYLIEALHIKGVHPRSVESVISPAVNKKTVSDSRVLYPLGVSPNAPVDHLEFALKHEGIDLGIISAVFDAIPPEQLSSRFNKSPNGEYIRRLCFMWEWMKGEQLPGVNNQVSATYIEMFPSDQYVTSDAVRHGRFRVLENAIGNRNFCPVVKRNTLNKIIGEDFAKSAITDIKKQAGEKVFQRAVQYLYLSETKNSFGIEKEVPDANRTQRFIALLQTCGDSAPITEDMLVSAQHKIVKDPFAQESSFRYGQNWLEDRHGQITVFPPSPDVLPRLMDGWLEFVNSTKKIHPVIKAACGAFGFVYLHPFYDGNGRIHRFLIHKILTQSGFVGDGVILPVSSVMLKDIESYLAVLNTFSKPVRDMWNYERIDAQSAPRITEHPGSTPYRFFDADIECDYLSQSIMHSLSADLPNEIAFLEKFDRSMEGLNQEIDLPQKDMSLLIRCAIENDGTVSKNRRKQFSHFPEDIFETIEKVVSEECGLEKPNSPGLPTHKIRG